MSIIKLNLAKTLYYIPYNQIRMKKIICKKRYIPLLITCLIPSFIYAHAGIYDRYLSALPAYYALTSISALALTSTPLHPY